jgi:hypothetical protein
MADILDVKMQVRAKKGKQGADRIKAAPCFPVRKGYVPINTRIEENSYVYC